MMSWLVRSSVRRDILLLLLATLLVYINAFQGAFQFDDYNVIVNNPRVHGWSNWWQDISAHGIRPLLKLSYVADWKSGMGAVGFHASNLLIHGLNAILAYELTRIFLRMIGSEESQTLTPLFAAMLFALHPMQTEAVTYISGRSSSLMTLFYLGGILAYARGRQNGTTWLLHGVVPLCMVLAMLVKETAVTFPAAILLWEWLGGGTLKQVMHRQWSIWLLLVAGLALFFLHVGYAREIHNSIGFNTLTGNLATQLLGLVYLMRQWFMPFWPNIDPDLPVLQNFRGLLPHVVILLGMLVLMVISWRRRPWLAFAVAWALLQLLPVYSVLPRMDVVNDRQLYLVSWPLALAISVELGKIATSQRLLIIGLILISLAFVSIKRNQDYRNETALWQATAMLSPHKARVQNNLGYALMLAGRKDEARRHYETALRLDPAFYRARYNLQMLEGAY